LEQFFSETEQPLTVQSGSTQQLTRVAVFIGTRILFTFFIIVTLLVIVGEIKQFSGDTSPKPLSTHPSVEMMVTEKLSASLELLIPALALSVLVGVPLGALMATRRYRRIDGWLRPVMLLFAAIPGFWLALILFAEVAIRHRLAPLGGRCPVSYSGECGPILQRLDYLWLPLIPLIIVGSSVVALYMGRVLAKEPTEATVSKRQFFIIDVLLALPPMLPFALVALIGNLVMVETVFNWPGAGRLLIYSAVEHDYSLAAEIIQTTSINLAAFFLSMNVLYAMLIIVLGKLPQNHNISPYPYLQEQCYTPRQAPPMFASAENPKPSNRSIHRLALLAGLFLLFVLVVIVFVPLIWNMSPNQIDGRSLYLPPGSDGHLLGTDNLGRDHLTRLIFGGRNALWLSFRAAVFALGIGAVVGGLVGTINHWGENTHLPAMLRIPINGILHVFGVLPWLPFLLIFAAAHYADTNALIIIFGVLGWVNLLPMIQARTQLMHQRRQDTAFLDMNDDLVPPQSGRRALLIESALVAVWAISINMATFLLIESCLSFLRLGVQEPTPTWGNMLTKGIQQFSVAPQLMYLPGIMIVFTIVCLYLLAERIRDRLDATK
jgi:peptide/nickel transport system permease protein